MFNLRVFELEMGTGADFPDSSFYASSRAHQRVTAPPRVQRICLLIFVPWIPSILSTECHYELRPWAWWVGMLLGVSDSLCTNVHFSMADDDKFLLHVYCTSASGLLWQAFSAPPTMAVQYCSSRFIGFDDDFFGRVQ